MTGQQQTASMKNARILETEILLPKPKKFVRELVQMPDGYRCDCHLPMPRPAERRIFTWLNWEDLISPSAQISRFDASQMAPKGG